MTRDSDDLRLPREGIAPTSGARATMACRACGATFPRSDVRSGEKGRLSCPECGARDLEHVGSD